MKRILYILAVTLLAASCCQQKEITRTELKNKIAGAWLGQMVGNIYGLEYENKFVEEPGEGPNPAKAPSCSTRPYARWLPWTEPSRTTTPTWSISI